MSKHKLPEGFGSWIEIYQAIEQLFPFTEIQDDYLIALTTKRLDPRYISDREWLKANSVPFMTYGELRAIVADEIMCQFDEEELRMIWNAIQITTNEHNTKRKSIHHKIMNQIKKLHE